MNLTNSRDDLTDEYLAYTMWDVSTVAHIQEFTEYARNANIMPMHIQDNRSIVAEEKDDHLELHILRHQWLS